MTTPDANAAPLETTTVDPSEVEKFTRIAAEWWDPKGKFRPLHLFNPTRLSFIRETVVAAKGLDPAARAPFTGLRLLDVGCGGGLLSEPMARLGAAVTGLDASTANVKTAQAHAAQLGLEIDYRAGTVEALLASGEAPYDVVLTMEVVEHVADVGLFLSACARLLAPGGVLILATLNRTPKAFVLAIVGAERVLRWLPPGTHEYAKFVRPDEARAPLAAEGLEMDPPVGVAFNPFTGRWSLSADASVNYMIVARRPEDGASS